MKVTYRKQTRTFSSRELIKDRVARLFKDEFECSIQVGDNRPEYGPGSKTIIIPFGYKGDPQDSDEVIKMYKREISSSIFRDEWRFNISFTDREKNVLDNYRGVVFIDLVFYLEKVQRYKTGSNDYISKFVRIKYWSLKERPKKYDGINVIELNRLSVMTADTLSYLGKPLEYNSKMKFNLSGSKITDQKLLEKDPSNNFKSGKSELSLKSLLPQIKSFSTKDEMLGDTYFPEEAEYDM